MTDENEALPPEVLLMCDLLDEVADHYLGFYELEVTRTEIPSRYEIDLETSKVAVGTSLIWDRLRPTCEIYLFESAHEIKSLATLLRANQIAGSLEVLSRAAIERCGRVSWLIDHNEDVTAHVRSARAAFELAVTSQHYRQVIESMYPRGHEFSKHAASQFRRFREYIEMCFTDVLKNESAEIAEWSLDGTTYPDYTNLAIWAWFSAEDRPKEAKTTYKMLCAFSHPSVAASREHQFVDDGVVRYRYDISYINKITSNAVAAFDKAFQGFCSYFDRSFDAVVAHQVSIYERWPPLNHDPGDA
jgi:hypothetical protein